MEKQLWTAVDQYTTDLLASPDPVLDEMLAAEPRVQATTIQTVGSKGYDGFTLALVTGS